MPLYVPGSEGPQSPVAATPRRMPGSIRRTSTIDTVRPEGPTGRMVMHGHARDLVTHGDDTSSATHADVLAEVSGANRELVEITTTPACTGVEALVGAVVGPGFRARAEEIAPGERDAHTLLYLLLDDLPGAALVSGYALLRSDTVSPGRNDEYLATASDMCAGWASDGTMIAIIRKHDQNPTPFGPPAPALGRDDDPIAFHELPQLPPGSMRRLRRIDVLASVGTSSTHPVDVFFRDTHVDDDGLETVVHEYSVAASVDAATRAIVDIEAVADVLPWVECPGAVASATRLVGHTLGDLRPHVRSTFVGTTTCTHLNDVLRGLSDIDVLLDALPDGGVPAGT